jgi:hypothetical protein
VRSWRSITVAAVLAATTATLAPLTMSAPATAMPARQPGVASVSELNSVWCSGPEYCLAVGPDTPVSVAWNGTSWRSVPAPASTLDLTQISCWSRTGCMATGTGRKSTGVIDRWNGKSWQSQGSAIIKTATPAAISCATGKAGPRCVTAGGRNDALAWNGKSWRKVTMAQPAGVINFEVTSVSCASITSCVAVGSYRKNFAQHGIAFVWHGSRWRRLQAPPATTNAISCAKPGHCVAVGDQASMIWNGRTWRKVPVGGISVVEVLDHISCPSLQFCMAEAPDAVVAWNGTTWKTLPGTKIDGNAGLWCTSPRFCMDVGQQASRWNGRTWTPVRLSKFDQLRAISCASSGDCVATGLSDAARFAGTTLAESWNGTAWRVLPVPLESIQAISCPTATFCLAMMDTIPGPQKAQSWDGTKWSALPSPSDLSDVQALSCSSPSNCVVVGSKTASIWNGTSWQPTSAFKGKNVFMDAVSCASATMCMAIGVDLSTHGLLAEKWDGSSWSVSFDTANDNAGQQGDEVSCPTTTFCMENTGTTTMSWDGSNWHQQNADVPEFSLTGLSCGSSSSCVLTEDIENSQSGAVSFAARTWNGLSWQASDLAHPVSRLAGVSCATATNCVAVGRSQNLAMAQHWNGSTWKLLTPVSP